MPKSIWKTFFTFTWATLFRKSNLSNNLFSLLKYRLTVFSASLYFLLIKAGVEKNHMSNDSRKLYYSEALDRYIMIDNQFTPLQALKAWKKKFCELNNIPLDKVIVFDGSVDYETIDQNYGLISWIKNHNDTNNLPSWEE